jgi:FAD/FMN-containing dehydrogenase
MPTVKIIKHYQSWGRFPKVKHQKVVPVRWRHELPDFNQIKGTVLPFGYGRSYGDSCLNEGGTLLDTSYLNQMMAFDAENGVIRVEAGVSLAELVEFLVPKGWFLPVTPGTKYVSVAGAIANDVHGKNHHASGTFGSYVTRFELMRSNGECLICSPTENVEMFNATIGGLGLTGLITWAEFRLKPIASPLVDVERIRFGNLDEFFEIDAESVHDYEYTVSWVDTFSTGNALGRGIYMRGNHYDPPLDIPPHLDIPSIQVPFSLPSGLLNPLTMRILCTTFYSIKFRKEARGIEHYNPYFYPLDSFKDWNRVYGPRGFLQYQFCVPDDRDAIKAIINTIAKAKDGSFVTVFKRFGDKPSPGMLSFPRPGITMALDFPNTHTLHPLLERLDEMVAEAGGRVYPAKDARMSARHFQTFYPNWQDFARFIDPKFSSSFWRRVTETI